MHQLRSECIAALLSKTYAMLRVLYCLQIGLYGEVLNYQVTPVGTTAYGTPRTFSATVVNLGTGSSAFGGSISFVDTNGDKLCTTTVQPNTALVGTNVIWLHAPLPPPPSHPASQADARLSGATELAAMSACNRYDPVVRVCQPLGGILGWRMCALQRDHPHTAVRSQTRLPVCA